MDGGEPVFLYHTLGNEDGILEVVAIPGHEGDAHVLPKRQLAHIDGRSIGQDVATGNHVTFLDQRLLADTGVLVGTGVLGQVVNVHTGFTGVGFLVVDPHDDAGSIDLFDDPAPHGHYAHTGVTGHIALHAGAHKGLLGFQGRHRLALHVGTHQGAVGVVMFQEGDERSCNRHHLLRRHVHIIHFFPQLQGGFTLVAHGHKVVDEAALLVQGSTGLGDDEIAFVDG